MKKPIIIEYKNIESLFDGSISYYGLIIPAMLQMKDAYHKCLPDARVESIGSLKNILLPKWNNVKDDFRRILLMQKYLDQMKQEYGNLPELHAMKENLQELLKAIKLLVEIGVDYKKLLLSDNSITTERKLFIELYRDMMQEKESGIQDFMIETSKWTDGDCFRERLRQVLNFVPNAVYFQGFYYITALQQRIIDGFLSLDIPVYFLNHIDRSDNQSNFFAIWDQNPFFKMITERRQIQYRGHSKDNSESSRGERKNQIRLCRYQDTFSMVNRFKKLQDDPQKPVFYAPMSRDIKDLLDTFFPENEEKTHILAYPIGRYLMTLYNMWNEERQELVFTPEDVRSCLSTGWAGKKVSDNSHLLEIYDCLFDYFHDCETLSDWKMRLKRLRCVEKEVMPLFNVPTGKKETERWRKFMVQPLRWIGAFSCTEEDINIVIEALEQMFRDSQILFDSSCDIRLGPHFKKLQHLLQTKASKSAINEEERALLITLQSRLSWAPNDIQSCPPSHLATAMSLFLGGKLDENLEDADGRNIKMGCARGISDIEAATILYRLKGNTSNIPIMLCCCDADSMPGKEKEYPWPLTPAMLQNIDFTDEQRLRMEDEKNCRFNTRLSNRYLFHIAAQLTNIEISWIAVQESGKEQNPSFYIRDVSSRYEIHIETINGLLINNDEHEAEAGGSTFHWCGGKEKFVQPYMPPEASMELKACKEGSWRFIYNFILSEYPCYTSEFQMRFYLSRLMAIMEVLLHLSGKDIQKYLSAIYPSRSVSEWSELITFADIKANEIERNNLTARDNYEDKAYTDLRYYLEFLDNNVLTPRKKNNLPGCDIGKTSCKFCPAYSFCYVGIGGDNETEQQ